MLIEKLFNDVDLFFEGKHEETEPDYFAFYVQDYLCDNYDEMYKENAEVTEFLNEDLPDICAEMDLGIDDKPFLDKLSQQLKLAKELFYKW